MKLVLRAIALVNYEHSMVSAGQAGTNTDLTQITQNADRARKGGTQQESRYASMPKVKRKIGFEYEDEEDVAEGKQQRMEENEGEKGKEKGEGMVIEE